MDTLLDSDQREALGIDSHTVDPGTVNKPRSKSYGTMLNLRDFVNQVSLEEAGAGSQREGHGLWSQETRAQQQGTTSTTCVTLGRKSHFTEPQTPYLKNKTMLNYTHKCTHMYYVQPTVYPSEC